MSRGVLLGSDGKPSRPSSLTILVPRGYEDAPRELVGHCRVPVDDDGTPCNARFYKGQEALWERHVGQCARRHMDVILKLRLEHRSSIFHSSQWDPEAEAHLAKVGRRMKRERRFEMRKNERIVNG